MEIEPTFLVGTLLIDTVLVVVILFQMGKLSWYSSNHFHRLNRIDGHIKFDSKKRPKKKKKDDDQED